MPLTSDEGAGSTTPLWTLDGKRILYNWDRENVFKGGVYSRASDGTGEVEKLASATGRGLFPYSLSPDGKSLVLWEVVHSPTLHQAIGMLSMEGDHARRELLHDEKYSVQAPRVSPNGRWMAYESNESGKVEIYVCSFPDVKKGNEGLGKRWKPPAMVAGWPGAFLQQCGCNHGGSGGNRTAIQNKWNADSSFSRNCRKRLSVPIAADMANFTYWDIDPDRPSWFPDAEGRHGSSTQNQHRGELV